LQFASSRSKVRKFAKISTAGKKNMAMKAGFESEGPLIVDISGGDIATCCEVDDWYAESAPTEGGEKNGPMFHDISDGDSDVSTCEEGDWLFSPEEPEVESDSLEMGVAISEGRPGASFEVSQADIVIFLVFAAVVVPIMLATIVVPIGFVALVWLLLGRVYSRAQEELEIFLRKNVSEDPAPRWVQEGHGRWKKIAPARCDRAQTPYEAPWL